MNKLALALLCIGLAACDPLEPTTPQAPELEEDREDLAPPAIEPGNNLTQPSSKPTAPVDVRYTVNPQGEQLEILLAITSSDPGAPLYISLLDASGETLVERQVVDMSPHKEGRAGTHRFLIDTNGHRERWVSVEVEADMEMGRLTRNLAIPVESMRPRRAMQSLQKTAPQEQLLSTDVTRVEEAGEAVLSLPADEINLR